MRPVASRCWFTISTPARVVGSRLLSRRLSSRSRASRDAGSNSRRASFRACQLAGGTRPPMPERARTICCRIAESIRFSISISGTFVRVMFVNSTCTLPVATRRVLRARDQWVMMSLSNRSPQTSRSLSGQSALLKASEKPFSIPRTLRRRSVRCSSSNWIRKPWMSGIAV